MMSHLMQALINPFVVIRGDVPIQQFSEVQEFLLEKLGSEEYFSLLTKVIEEELREILSGFVDSELVSKN